MLAAHCGIARLDRRAQAQIAPARRQDDLGAAIHTALSAEAAVRNPRIASSALERSARGTGISLSAVGRGWVVLDGEPRAVDDDLGVYSLDGADCSLDPTLCTPLPLVPERFLVEPPVPRPQPKVGS